PRPRRAAARRPVSADFVFIDGRHSPVAPRGVSAMTWNRWLSALQRSARPTRRPRRDCRPRLEELEDRTLFSVSVLSVAATRSPPANGQSEVAPMHSVSDDGRYTVFASTATNLVANQTTDSSGSKFLNIYLYDAKQQTTTLITHASGSGNSAKEANGNS